ncbi:MAG: hypothetical protein QF408_11330 [Pirellulales bacterium]|nr:hypothetical protein [Pirellulales bacterium]
MSLLAPPLQTLEAVDDFVGILLGGDNTDRQLRSIVKELHGSSGS